jgi:hypothetical protein
MIKLSSSRHILNAHRAALGASKMLLEQEKNAPNWESAIGNSPLLLINQ